MPMQKFTIKFYDKRRLVLTREVEATTYESAMTLAINEHNKEMLAPWPIKKGFEVKVSVKE